MIKTTVVTFALFTSGFLNAHAQNIGEQKELPAGALSTHAEWNQGFGKCEPQNSRADGTWAPGRGWAIVGKRKLETEANNGGGDIELVDGGPTYPSVTTVYTQFSLLVALARATKNTSASQDIQNVQNSWLKAREGLPAQTRAAFYVWANAHGSCWDQKGGSAGYSFFVNIRYVGDESALANTVNSLKSKYFPDL
jgi:hypothetical protein